jgi:hypothetical protein
MPFLWAECTPSVAKRITTWFARGQVPGPFMGLILLNAAHCLDDVTRALPAGQGTAAFALELSHVTFYRLITAGRLLVTDEEQRARPRWLWQGKVLPSDIKRIGAWSGDCWMWQCSTDTPALPIAARLQALAVRHEAGPSVCGRDEQL